MEASVAASAEVMAVATASEVDMEEEATAEPEAAQVDMAELEAVDLEVVEAAREATALAVATTSEALEAPATMEE
jgi:hypothetical protein